MLPVKGHGPGRQSRALPYGGESRGCWWRPPRVRRLPRQPPDQRPVARSLTLVAGRLEKARLEGAAVDYEKVGTATEVATVPAGTGYPESPVRGKLGQESGSSDPAAGNHRRAPEQDLPAAREWAEPQPLRQARVRPSPPDDGFNSGDDLRVVWS